MVSTDQGRKQTADCRTECLIRIHRTGGCRHLQIAYQRLTQLIQTFKETQMTMRKFHNCSTGSYSTHWECEQVGGKCDQCPAFWQEWRHPLVLIMFHFPYPSSPTWSVTLSPNFILPTVVQKWEIGRLDASNASDSEDGMAQGWSSKMEFFSHTTFHSCQITCVLRVHVPPT